MTSDAFLRTILDSPDDDGPRLVFADWLEERGDCERAEFIRLQCLGGDPERLRELIHLHGQSWAGPAAHHTYSLAFQRGFVEEITASAIALLRHGEELFASAPIALVRVIRARDYLGRLLQWPPLLRVRALHLTGCKIGDAGAARLAACPHLAGLHVLRLGGNAIGDDGAEALADSDSLARLHTLILHDNLIGDLGVQLLATTPHLPALRVLDLSHNQIGEAGAEVLAASCTLPGLQRLDLSDQFKGSTAGLALRRRAYPIQPRQQRSLLERFGAACIF